MANTRTDQPIATGVWVNLFAGSSITIGTACTAYNKGSAPLFLYTATSAPSVPTGVPPGIPLCVEPQGFSLAIPSGASGLWAYCQDIKGGLVLLQD